MSDKKQYNWTKQSDFTHDDIKKRLVGFSKVSKSNLGILKLGMWIKYITVRDGNKVFRQGGILTYIDPEARYIMLKSLINEKIAPWSVQLNNSTLFYKEQLSNENKQKITDIINHVGNIKVLEKIIDVMGENPDEILKNIKHINKNYNGKISNIFK